MNRRAATARRCPQCRMVQQLCICALLPRIETRTRVVVVVHHEEAQKPTNTGLLAARCLASSRVVVTGVRDQPITSSPLGDDDAPAALLFPSDDATPLTSSSRIHTLVVPDGTWRQARKMRSRVPGLDALPCVTLAPPEAGQVEPTAYRLRTERREGGLATLEAIARALAILEQATHDANDVERELLDIFRVMVDRTLWLRGSLRDDEVTGGIPEAARAHDPRGGLPHLPRVPRAR
jgi:DTW domain-containing protein